MPSTRTKLDGGRRKVRPAIALPESVRVVIGARVGRLGPAAEHVLSVAAVIGRDFDLDVLARATSITEEELLDILDAATAAALVRELANAAGRYIFAHALIQHTLYEDLGPTRQLSRIGRWQWRWRSSAANGQEPASANLLVTGSVPRSPWTSRRRSNTASSRRCHVEEFGS